MTKVVSVINLKGGVGKTALAVNLAAYCGKEGRKTLLIDLDPQTNATFSSIGVERWDTGPRRNGTVADLLGVRRHTSATGRQKLASEVIIKNVFENVDLIPSHIDLFTIDLDLAAASFRETKLKKALEDTIDLYDIVICDCPPNLTLPTQNALAFSTNYIIPVTLDFLSSIGVSLLISRVKEFSSDLENSPVQSGIIISRVGRPANHREETENTLREQFGESVLDNTIKERSSVSKMAQSHKPIFESTDGSAITEFNEVCKELLDNIGI